MASRGTVADVDAPSLVVELGDPFFADVRADASPLRGFVDAGKIREIEKLIAHHGGVVVGEGETATHEVRALGRAATGTPGATCVHPEWVHACVNAKKMLDVESHALYAPPVSLEGMESARDCVVCVTGYQGQRRRDVETMSRVLGAKFQKAFDRHVTHLVCYEHAGAKWERARDLGRAKIVNHRWLEESVTRWTRADESAYASRSGKEEDELAAQCVPDSEGEDEPVGEKETSVIPDSVVEGAASGGKGKSASDANIVVAPLVSQRTPAPTKTKTKTPSTFSTKNRSGGRGKSANKVASTSKISFRSPDWEEEARRGAHVKKSTRSRIDPSVQRALREGVSQPDPTFVGLIGSPNDIETAFGGRFAPSNAWFNFFDDGDDEPLTDMATLDDFYGLMTQGRRSLGVSDVDDKIRRIRSGETRFEVFEMGISEAREEEVLQPNSGLVMQTLYSGTVVLISQEYRQHCEKIVQLVDALEMQQQQGTIGSIVHAILHVETAKQPIVHEERVKPGPEALIKTFLTFLKIAHNFNEVDNAQLFNEDGTLAPADKIITLPEREPGNLRGVVLQKVQRKLRDVLAGLYELLAGPTEPDPTQHAPYSQQVVSQVELNDVDDEVAEEEDVPPMPPREEEDVPPPLPEVEPEAEVEEEAVEIQKVSTKQSTPIVRPKRTRAVATPAQEETAQPSKKKTPPTKSKLTAKQVSTTKKAQSRPPKRVEETVSLKVKAHITLSGFSSAGIKKYSSIVRRIGAELCAGHEWDPSTTHVIFGERGSRSIKFLAGAVSGASLLDVTYLDACARAGEVLTATEKYLWRGGRGSEMGLISSNASKHWSKVPGANAFAGLSIALLPFAPGAKLEQKMLDVVLRAGGASLSSVSSKGDVCLTQARAPDLVVSDQVDARSLADVPRLEPLVESGGDVTIVSPEFFKSWISTPETALDDHCLFGTTLKEGSIDDALAKRGETSKRDAGRAKKAPRAKPAPKAAPRKQKKKGASDAPPVLMSQRQTRAKRAANAPLATRVRSKRRVLKDSN